MAVHEVELPLLIIVQRDAAQSRLFIILQVHSTCVGCQPHPSSGVHKAVTTASGTGHIFCAATSLQRGQAWPRWREVCVLHYLECLSRQCSTNTHHGQIRVCCHNNDYVHANEHDRTITVILAKHCIKLPDDESLVIRNMLEQ